MTPAWSYVSNLDQGHSRGLKAADQSVQDVCNGTDLLVLELGGGSPASQMAIAHPFWQ
jgi:hypothetical protein